MNICDHDVKQFNQVTLIDFWSCPTWTSPGNPYLNEKQFFLFFWWVMCLLESSSWDILDMDIFHGFQEDESSNHY
jgi:hypothetical protein